MRSYLKQLWRMPNIEKAIQRVMSNKGSGGVDKMQVAEVRTHFAQHWSLSKETYHGGTL